MGLAQGKFAVWETSSGVVLLHVKAARQRIQYEKVQRELQGGEVSSQPLLFPVPLELDPVSSGLLEEHRGSLQKQGFTIEPFGRNFFRVEAVPAWLDPGQAEDFLRDLIHLAKDPGWSDRTSDSARDEMAKLASRLVTVNVEDRTDTEKMTWLVQSLMRCDHPLTCPFGRPTYIELGRGELNRRFRL